MQYRIITVSVLILVFSALTALAQGHSTNAEQGRALNSSERSEVIESVIKRLNESYVFPEVARNMERRIRERMRQGAYEKIVNGAALAEQLASDLRAVSRDTHLRVHFSARPLSPMGEVERKETPAEREEMRRDMAQINNGFVRVERLAGNIGYLDLDSFIDPEFSGETTAAAMNFLANTEALVIDLRYNTGGNARMVALLCSYLFDSRPVHLNDIYSRPSNSTKQYWTLSSVPGKRFTGKDVYVLTSKRTHSAAEAFAYNLQVLRRATIIGEVTRGGAHPVTRYRITEHFAVAVPTARAINPITKSNWEGTGVKPDILASMDVAVKTAHLAALKSLASKGTLTQEERSELDNLISKIQAGIAQPAPAQSKTANEQALIDYVGRYDSPIGALVITLEGSRLFAQPPGEERVELLAEYDGQFTAKGMGATLTFIRNSQSRVTHIVVNMGGSEVKATKVQ